MANWVRVLHEGKPTYGQVEDGQIRLCTGSPFEQFAPLGVSINLADARWLPVVEPRQFLGLWNNFHETRAAGNLFMPKTPLYFAKLASSLTAHRTEIQPPPGYTSKIKFEAELGIVIGKPCFQVSLEDVDNYILGYTCVNDVSAVETLFEEPGFTHWIRAKSFPTFGPVGPVIVTDIEPDNLRVKAVVNGVEKQNYPVNDMIFRPREIVSIISQDVRLLPGDVISCGTSSGADVMVDGDTIDIVIDGIGTLTNYFRT
jgi:2-keto-4-pentenoate hydratase/2-oxohepta-3-ene-1,7-dioic acid hydratase in catechol pathway